MSISQSLQDIELLVNQIEMANEWQKNLKKTKFDKVIYPIGAFSVVAACLYGVWQGISIEFSLEIMAIKLWLSLMSVPLCGWVTYLSISAFMKKKYKDNRWDMWMEFIENTRTQQAKEYRKHFVQMLKDQNISPDDPVIQRLQSLDKDIPLSKKFWRKCMHIVKEKELEKPWGPIVEGKVSVSVDTYSAQSSESVPQNFKL